MELQIISQSAITNQEIKALLEKQISPESEVKLEIRQPEIVYRGLDPSILVAIVGAAGTGLGALITGISQLLKEHANQKIVVQTEGKFKIEIPANISPEKLGELIEQIKKLDED